MVLPPLPPLRLLLPHLRLNLQLHAVLRPKPRLLLLLLLPAPPLLPPLPIPRADFCSAKDRDGPRSGLPEPAAAEQPSAAVAGQRVRPGFTTESPTCSRSH